MRMKKLFPIFLALIASLGVLSCDVIPQPSTDADGSQYQSGPALEILSKSVVFTPQGGTGTIVVNTTAPLTARSDRGWIDVSVSGNCVTLTVQRNESIESRYSSITLRAGGASAEVTAQQFGINSAYAWDESYTFPFAGGSLTLPYGETGTVWVDVSELPWLTAAVDEENKTIEFTAAKSIYNWERKGDVSVKFGEDIVKSIRFIQESNPSGINPGDAEPVDFEVQAAWTPKYVDPAGPDDPISVVGVDVAEDSHAGRYFIHVVTKADFVAAGSDEQLFLNRNASAWAEAGPQIFRASSTLEIEKLALGNYRIYAIGVDNENQVNGSYAVTEFAVTKVLSPYEKFLGTWSFDRNGTEDVWTVTEKVAGKTYNVTGIDGIDDVTVEAEFNADGTVTIRAQKDLGEHTVSTSSGNLTGQAAIYGRILYSGSEYYVTGTYPIFTITFDAKANTGSLAPGSVSTNVGSFDLIGFGIYTIVDNSAYAATNKATLPATITHLTWAEGSGGGEGGGGGGNDNPGTDAYGKWIGTWTVGDVTLTVAQKVAGQTYTVSGLEGFDIETRFVDGKMEFFYQVLAEEGAKSLCFFGIDDDGDGYIVEGDPENDGWLATATLNSAGTSADLVGAEFDAVYSGTTYHERIVTMLLLIYDGDEGQFYYASDNHMQIDMPTKMTKSSSASVKALRSAGFDSVKNEFIPLYKSFHNGPRVPYKLK